MKEIVVSAENAGSRLDKFLMKYLNKAPKSLVYKLLRKKCIKLGGKRAKGSELLKEGEVISLFLGEETFNSLREEKQVKSYDLNFDIVYEDRDIIVADKPVGMLTQADKAGGDCLNARLLSYLSRKGELKEGFTPSVCNRLDRNTGGLVTFGKTLRGARELSLGFKEHFIKKYYICIVKGNVEKPLKLKGSHIKEGNKAVVFDAPKDGAKEIVTYVYPLCNNGRFSLLKIGLETGKTHQIRAALSKEGHPIAGDPKYGDKAVNDYFYKKYGLKHQLLYCYEMIFDVKEGEYEALKPVTIRGSFSKLTFDVIKGEFDEAEAFNILK